MRTNYHTHTVRCKHAVGTEREYIEAAIAKGFEVLGFSDHVPQPYPPEYVSRIRMEMSQRQEYMDTLKALREEYRDKIRIRIGFEAEYSPRFFEPLMEELKKDPPDYLLLGQHFVPDEVYGVYSGNETDSEEILSHYVDLVIEGMRTGEFLYVAHPDLLYFTGPDQIYRKHMERLIADSIENHYPLEFNIHGFLGKRWYPSERFFSMASEMGATFVLGCDAHDPRIILQPEEFPEVMEFLEKNGIQAGKNIWDDPDMKKI